MAKSFLKLNIRRALADGTYPIQIAVGYGTDLYIGTDISVYKSEWDAATKMCIGTGAKRINDTLSTLLAQVSNRILDLREKGIFDKLTKSQIKAMLQDMSRTAPPPSKSNALGPVFRRVISTKNKRNAELYAQTLAKLEKYCNVDTVIFDDINRTWLTEFYTCPDMKMLATNTKAIHMRNLRNVINYAIDDNITNNYPFRKFRIPREDTPMLVLPLDSMRKLLHMEFKDRRKEEHRDMFLLTFYLIGINMADLSVLTEANIINGRIEYRRAKTHKMYSILLTDEAKLIIDKYKGENHLLRCFDRYKLYIDYVAHMKKSLRSMLPEYDKITPYWARYSWATYAAKLNIPKDTISEALGHEHGSRTTKIYIEYDRALVDKANKAVIKYMVGKKSVVK